MHPRDLYRFAHAGWSDAGRPALIYSRAGKRYAFGPTSTQTSMNRTLRAFRKSARGDHHYRIERADWLGAAIRTPDPCAQGGFRPALEVVYFQVLRFQLDVGN